MCWYKKMLKKTPKNYSRYICRYRYMTLPSYSMSLVAFKYRYICNNNIMPSFAYEYIFFSTEVPVGPPSDAETAGGRRPSPPLPAGHSDIRPRHVRRDHHPVPAQRGPVQTDHAAAGQRTLRASHRLANRQAGQEQTVLRHVHNQRRRGRRAQQTPSAGPAGVPCRRSPRPWRRLQQSAARPYSRQKLLAFFFSFYQTATTDVRMVILLLSMVFFIESVEYPHTIT